LLKFLSKEGFVFTLYASPHFHFTLCAFRFSLSKKRPSIKERRGLIAFKSLNKTGRSSTEDDTQFRRFLLKEFFHIVCILTLTNIFHFCQYQLDKNKKICNNYFVVHFQNKLKKDWSE